MIFLFSYKLASMLIFFMYFKNTHKNKTNKKPPNVWQLYKSWLSKPNLLLNCVILGAINWLLFIDLFGLKAKSE